MATGMRAATSNGDGSFLGSEAVPVRRLDVDRAGARGSPTHVLVVDASLRQALVATRSLGRSGLRVGTAESPDLLHPRFGVPAFVSRWSDWHAILPSYHRNPDAYASSVLELAGRHRAQVVIPSIDGSIAALRPLRRTFEERGTALAMPSESALAVANDKERTLAVAHQLGIAGPRTVSILGADDVRAAVAEVGLPAVIKPTESWSRRAATSVRVITRSVVTETEACDYVDELHRLGSSAIVQQWVGGRRESVNLLYAGGQVRAAIAQVAYRTAPVLGGVSVVRETIPMPPELWVPAVSLTQALGLEGYSEIEFRRDATGRPLIMEINARLTAGIELAVRAGVDFPQLVWRWATGQAIPAQTGYRPGVRMRFLPGDLEWLWENIKCRRRPDSVSPTKATLMFAREFLRPQAYDYVDRKDLKPALVASALEIAEITQRARAKWRAPG
jgi:glutathione synthase/RimK-type ligase-like ATP-grasp enzyme